MAISKKNKTNGTLPLLAGAIGFGIAAALFSYLYLKAREAAILESLRGQEQVMVSVVVANRNLPRGTVVADGLFAVRSVPSDFVHGDAVMPAEYDSYLGRALVTDLELGKPLLKSFLDEDFPLDFSDTIPLGRRAMTVTVDEVNSVAGFIRPGNHIDILVNIPYSNSGFDPQLYTVGVYTQLPPDIEAPNIPGGFSAILNQPADVVTQLLTNLAPGDVILPVLQNMRVLATGMDPYNDSLDTLRQPQFRSDTNFTSVTLDVSPEQAALLTAAQDKGDLLAILRNRNDEGASTFTSVSARDLFTNASQMALAEQERASRTTVADGVDTFGNLVDAEGNRIISRDELEAAGYTVNENGQILDSNGNVVNPSDLVVSKDGTVMTKQQLAAAGLTVNDSGQIVDRDGNVVSANDVVVTSDGSVVTRQQLAAAGLTINDNGEIVDNKGKVVSPGDIMVAEDGSIISKQQLEAAGLTVAANVDSNGNLVDASGNVIASSEKLAAAGLTVNENGQIVDSNGNVVDPNNLIVTADGSVMTREQFADAGLSLNESGQLVDKNGNVVSASDIVVASDGKVLNKKQLAEAGLTVNENGQIVDSNGNVVDPAEIVVAADGNILTGEQLAEAGLTINENGEIVDQNGRVVDPDSLVVASDGTVLTQQQLAAAGLNINSEGKIVDASGNVVNSNDLVTTSDGTVVSRQQLAAAGLTVNDNGEIVDNQGRIVSAEQVAQLTRNVPITGTGTPGSYDMVIGGASTDGVAKSQKVLIDAQE
jgi:pilus assembly protein CpaB